jgi:hypothetical protein
MAARGPDRIANAAIHSSLWTACACSGGNRPWTWDKRQMSCGCLKNLEDLAEKPCAGHSVGSRNSFTTEDRIRPEGNHGNAGRAGRLARTAGSDTGGGHAAHVAGIVLAAQVGSTQCAEQSVAEQSATGHSAAEQSAARWAAGQCGRCGVSCSRRSSNRQSARQGRARPLHLIHGGASAHCGPAILLATSVARKRRL